jgi:periplasmic divalent cation tolerance protein
MEAAMGVIPVEITVTCGSAEQARTIGRKIVESGLGACAQHWEIASCYRWQGEVIEETEWLLLVKSQQTHFESICAVIRSLHSYDLPAIVMVPILGSATGYVEWLAAETSGTLGSLD